MHDNKRRPVLSLYSSMAITIGMVMGVMGTYLLYSSFRVRCNELNSEQLTALSMFLNERREKEKAEHEKLVREKSERERGEREKEEKWERGRGEREKEVEDDYDYSDDDDVKERREKERREDERREDERRRRERENDSRQRRSHHKDDYNTRPSTSRSRSGTSSSTPPPSPSNEIDGKGDRAMQLYRKNKETKGGPKQIRGSITSTIFIAMTAYRDFECGRTLVDMYNKSVNPSRLFPRIIQHISLTEPGESCLTYLEYGRCKGHKRERAVICDFTENIKIFTYEYTEGKGPLDARHMVQSLLQHEEFAFMIDAHSFFTERWDEKIMNNWNDLGDEMAIITTYPNAYVSRDDPLPEKDTISALCYSKFLEELKIPRHQGGLDTTNWNSHLTPYWSACISFSKSHAFRAVMFDCCAPFTFEGEEFSYSARLWTHGYDFYTPNTNILYHQYYHPGLVKKVKKKTFAENKWGENFITMVQSNERLRRMLGMAPMKWNGREITVNNTNIELYSLGNARSREDYMKFSRVDLDKLTDINMCVEIVQDKLEMVPLKYVPQLKESGLTVDPHPSLRQ